MKEPKAAETTSFSDQYKNPRWQKKRLEIMERDGFACTICGDDESTLNVHHSRYIKGKKVWDYPKNMLITLCEDCHRRLHDSFNFFNDQITSGIVYGKGGRYYNLLYILSDFLYAKGPDSTEIKMLISLIDNLMDINEDRQEDC